MPKVTYDSLKQQLEQGDSLSLKSTEGVVALNTGSVNTATTGSKPAINFPMDDFSYESALVGKKSDLNKLLSLTDSDGQKVNGYAGSQLIFNSDRVVINSRLDYLMLCGQAGIVISSPGNVNIDADDAVTIYGEDGLYLGVPGKGVGLDEGGGVKKLPKTKADATIDTDYEPLVLGLKLANLLEDLLISLKNATILTSTGKAYFREDTMYDLACLQSRLPEILSTYGYIDGISHEVPDPPPEPPTISDTLSTSVTGTTAGPTSTAGTDTVTGNASTTITSPLQNQPDYFETQSPYPDLD